ncbi:MAG: ribonuclease HI [Thermoproteus sp.]
MRCAVYFDGACEPVNPGGLGTYGYVIYDESGRRLDRGYGVACHGDGCTNNVAEYVALREVLRRAKELGCDEVEIRGDSQLVVRQIRGEWAVNSLRLMELKDEVEALLAGFARWSVEWVPREANKEADGLSQIAYEVYATQYGYGGGDGWIQTLIGEVRRAAEAEGLRPEEAARILAALLRKYRLGELRELAEG